MKPLLALFGLLCVCTGVRADSRPNFPVAPLSSFDGVRWGGLILGATTFREVHDRFSTGRGAYETTTQLRQAANAGVRVDCLWTKRGDDEILSAITLRYDGATPTSQQLGRAFDPDGTQGVALYERGRFEDWRIVSFPARGVAAFQVRPPAANDYATPLLLLCPPGNLSRLERLLEREETPVEERVDPFANQPKVAEFGEVSLSLSGKGADEVPGWVRDDLREELCDAGAGGTLFYRRGATGCYGMSITVKRGQDGDSGSFSVSTDIQASGPYGPIHAWGSGSSKWKRGDNSLPNTPDQALRRAVRAARRDAERDCARFVRASGPPSLAALREARWNGLVATLRQSEVAPPPPTAPVAGF